MNSMTSFNSPAPRKGETSTRPQLESLIERRRMQIKILYALRTHLSDLRGEKQDEEPCQVMPFPLRTFASTEWLNRDSPMLDVSIFTQDEQALLAQMLHAEKSGEGEIAPAPLTIQAKKIDAMKMTIRDRIDELHQLNREDQESLRVLYLS